MISAIVLIIVFIYGMYLLHSLAKNDFVLLRKNVSLHELFDAMLLSIGLGLLVARIFFVVDMQEFSWFHPFRFFHLVKLPGLSLYGFFVGIIPILFLMLRKKKVLYRVFDIVALAMFPLFVAALVLREYSLVLPSFVVQLLLLAVGWGILAIFMKFFHNYTLRDGSLSLIIFLLVSLDLFLYGFLIEHPPMLLSLSLSQIAALVACVGSFVFFVINQRLLPFGKNNMDTHALTILFENDSVMVVNKPFGTIVNRADTTKAYVTLQDSIEQHWKGKNLEWEQADTESDFYKRAGIVHRIDKETSGALIVAKNSTAFSDLQKQFKEKTVEKEYVALCHGKVTPEEGVIDVPVGRLPWNRKKFGVITEGRQSVTGYRVDKIYIGPNKEPLSLVLAYPKTGRTHQIRVHMRYLGFPIFGDPLYAGRKNSRRDRKYLERHFLHARKIVFHDPISNSPLTIEAPMPSELVDFLASLTLN